MQPTQSPNTSEVKKVIWVAVKEKARELIGQPKPTRVRGSKRDGRRRAGVTGGLDIYDPPEREMEIPNLPRMATNPALHGRAVTGIPSRYLHDAKKRREEKESLFHFSPAAVAHANFLLQSQGPEAMEQYLKEIKENHNMDHSQIASDIRDKREKEEHKIGSGLEAELERLEARAKHCFEQAADLEKEATMLTKTASKLREALEMMGGGLAKRQYSRVGGGVWPERFKEILVRPMLKKELINEIYKRHSIKNAYAPVGKALESGHMREVDGMIELVPDDGE